MFTLFKMILVIIVGSLVCIAEYKEAKALLSFKKMPEFINKQSKPVIINSLIYTILDIILAVLSVMFIQSYIFFVLLLIMAIIAIETIFYIDDELHSIIGN